MPDSLTPALEDAERQLGVRFPQQLREFLLAPRQQPSGARWYSYRRDGRVARSWVERFRVVRACAPTDVTMVQVPVERQGEFPSGMVSIATGPGGQEVLIACGSEHSGSVWLKDTPACARDDEPNGHLYFIAPSLGEFLAALGDEGLISQPFSGPSFDAPERAQATPEESPSNAARSLLLIEPLAQGYDLVDEQWREEYIRREWCERCTAIRSSASFDEPVLLRREPRRKLSGAKPFIAIHESILKCLLPFVRNVVMREVRIGTDTRSDWVCMHYHPAYLLECDRGRFARHKQCSACGVVSREAMEAHPVVLERDLDDRQFYLSAFNEMLMEPSAFRQSGIAEVLPGIKTHEVPVVTRSFSGEVLPGDPGWSGKLRSARRAVIPAGLTRTSLGLYL